MNLAVLATIVYGLLSGFGGIWGYLKSQSKPSLISGCISGILLIIAAVMQLQGNQLGLLLSKIITLLLVVVFIIRLIKTGKFIPSGIMLMTGVIVLICLFTQSS
ncbi:MAG: TMEM14 family protein [Pleurocapsa sp. MO_226.B13]|nr:TMEM14 family protein [Pleurocapsa sp. MO_226.B13]